MSNDTVDGQANDCRHDSATGVDATSPTDPAKVWACDHCGLRWRQDGEGQRQSEPTQADLDRQKADHFQHLYEAASAGKCGYSGLPFRQCKNTICDCFEFPWIKPYERAAGA